MTDNTKLSRQQRRWLIRHAMLKVEIPAAQRTQEIQALSRYCDIIREHDEIRELLGHA
jgi:hypothetical protein